MPDPNLEDYLRELAGLPPAEHDGANYGMPPMPEDGETQFDSPPAVEEELDIPEGTEPFVGDEE
jgi:hypothetical protein